MLLTFIPTNFLASQMNGKIKGRRRRVTVDTENTAGKQRTRKVTPSDLDFGPANSAAVISSAQKFILPVPNLGPGGEPLVYPLSHEKAGQPILDWRGQPVGERGLVFFNQKDHAWQAVAGDGQGVIILNEVTPEQAHCLDHKVRQFNPDPHQLTLAQLKEVLDYARFRLGLGDMYNSSRAFVQTKMVPVVVEEAPRLNGKEIEAYGFKRRNDRDVLRAVYVPGKFVFTGPAITCQMFEDGGIILEQDGDWRGIQPDVFLRTYRRQDGHPINALPQDLHP